MTQEQFLGIMFEFHKRDLNSFPDEILLRKLGEMWDDAKKDGLNFENVSEEALRFFVDNNFDMEKMIPYLESEKQRN